MKLAFVARNQGGFDGWIVSSSDTSDLEAAIASWWRCGIPHTAYRQRLQRVLDALKKADLQ